MSETEQPGADKAPEREEIVPERSQEGAVQEQESQPTESELEKVASAMGWRPDGGNKSAAEYIRDTASINQSLKQRIERQEQEFGQRITGIQKMSERALVNQRENLWRQWEAAKDNAASVGDEKHYQELKRGQYQALQQFDEHNAPVVQEQRGQQQQPPEPEVVEFATKNQHWYMKDRVMTAASIVMLDDVDQQFPNFPLNKRLEIVEQRMEESFPGKIRKQSGNGAVPAQQQVEGGLRQIRTNRGKGFNELPPEAKSQATKEVKQGLFKDVHAWAAEYHSYEVKEKS